MFYSFKYTLHFVHCLNQFVILASVYHGDCIANAISKQQAGLIDLKASVNIDDKLWFPVPSLQVLGSSIK